MGSGIIAFLLTTKLGRSISAALLIALGVGIAWWAFSDHYYDKGVAACEAGYKALQGESNRRQSDLNNQSNVTSSAVANAADKAGAAVIAATDSTVTGGKENVRIIYRDPPKTAPVAPGSCVHPVDRRVQSRIEAARAAANRAAGDP